MLTPDLRHRIIRAVECDGKNCPERIAKKYGITIEELDVMLTEHMVRQDRKRAQDQRIRYDAANREFERRMAGRSFA